MRTIPVVELRLHLVGVVEPLWIILNELGEPLEDAVDDEEDGRPARGHLQVGAEGNFWCSAARATAKFISFNHLIRGPVSFFGACWRWSVTWAPRGNKL